MNILAVLTLGPAYGLQVHSEVEARTCRVGAINVGQIYSTLNRLIDAGLVVTASQTDDRLPLYELTPAGHLEVWNWLGVVPSRAPGWDDMVQHILLASSLPDVDLPALIIEYERTWRERARPDSDGVVDLSRSTHRSTQVPDAHGLGLAADRLLAAAAIDWLGDVRSRRREGELEPYGLSEVRPKRGRRPAATA